MSRDNDWRNVICFTMWPLYPFTCCLSLFAVEQNNNSCRPASNLSGVQPFYWHCTYRVIHKSLQDFRPLRYSSRDGHTKGEHVNRGRDTPSFCPTLQVRDMFLPHTWNVCGRNLITGLTSAAPPRVDISSTCKVGQKLGVSVPLLTCSPSAWPSWILYHRCRKSRSDLWTTLYFWDIISVSVYCGGI